MASKPDSTFVPPTRTGEAEGRDPVTGTAWAFEPPEVHWAEHDRRHLEYWLSRPPAERLAQAAAYRVRVHGLVEEPSRWAVRFVAPHER